jgi:hypothetical protein
MNAARVANLIDSSLRLCGFTKRGRTWNRRLGQFVDVIHLQTSKSGDAITLNIGVLDPDVYSLCWGSDPPLFIDEPSCIIRKRIGQLMGELDLWWSLECDRSAEEALDALEKHALPFLDRTHSRQRMLDVLLESEVDKRKIPPEIIYLAILRFLSGDVRSACEELKAYSSVALGAWREKAERVSARLGCS